MIGPDASAEALLEHMRSQASAEAVEGMKRFGICTETALGLSNPQLQGIARKAKRNQARATELWATGIREARMLAIYTAEPSRFDTALARRWADDFQSWEIVDTAADLFVEAGLQDDLVPEFADDPREFVRRTAFAMIAGAAVHLKAEPDTTFYSWLKLIEATATDERNFVRKAVNWALRNIGKRNLACHAEALALARRLAAAQDKTARWIGTDAVRELTTPKILARIERKG